LNRLVITKDPKHSINHIFIIDRKEEGGATYSRKGKGTMLLYLPTYLRTVPSTYLRKNPIQNGSSGPVANSAAREKRDFEFQMFHARRLT
jgi:hypothetical protein